MCSFQSARLPHLGEDELFHLHRHRPGLLVLHDAHDFGSRPHPLESKDHGQRDLPLVKIFSEALLFGVLIRNKVLVVISDLEIQAELTDEWPWIKVADAEKRESANLPTDCQKKRWQNLLVPG